MLSQHQHQPLRVAVLSALAVLTLATPAVASYTSEVTADGPAGYWHLESTPPANTGFGSDAPGTLGAQLGGNGATSVPGAVGNAAAFDGNGYLGTQGLAASVPTITFEGLFKLAALPAAGQFGELFDSTDDFGNGLILAVSSSGSLGVQSNLDSIFALTPGQLPVDGSFHHVVFSREAGVAVTLYVDGALVWSHAASAAPLTPSTAPGFPFHTIAGGPNPGARIVGALDEPAIYGHTLSLARVQAHVAAIGGGPPPPPQNTPPTCQQSTRLIAQDTPTAISASCSDADNDPLTFGLVSSVTQQGGTLTPAGSSGVTYTPPSASFTGPDSFDFTVSDGHVTVTFTAQLYVYPTGATADVADPGETVGSTTPTAAQPVTAAVTTPTGGVVTISASTAPPPSGFELDGTSYTIVAPLASVTQPLLVTLTTSSTNPVIPTRDGALITALCTGAGATPDPCIGSDTTSDTIRTIVIRTSHASTWQLVTPGKPGKGCGDKKHAHANEAGCKKLK